MKIYDRPTQGSNRGVLRSICSPYGGANVHRRATNMTMMVCIQCQRSNLSAMKSASIEGLVLVDHKIVRAHEKADVFTKAHWAEVRRCKITGYSITRTVGTRKLVVRKF